MLRAYRSLSSLVHGQSLVEMLVLAALVTALIAVPIDGSNSVIDLLLTAIRTAFARFLGAVSLPI